MIITFVLAVVFIIFLGVIFAGAALGKNKKLGPSRTYLKPLGEFRQKKDKL
jgi:hypothetical protein